MNLDLPAVGDWLVRTIVAGGFVLALAWLLMVAIRSVEGQHRVGSAAVRVVLLIPLLTLLPTWIAVPLPSWRSGSRDSVGSVATVATTPALTAGVVTVPFVDFGGIEAAGQVTAGASGSIEPKSVAEESLADEPASKQAGNWSWSRLALALFALGSGGMLLRGLLGMVGIGRLVRRAQPAGTWLRNLLPEEAASARVRLLVAEGWPSPICVKFWRPTIIVPRSLLGVLDAENWRWILRHEWEHLRRGDPRTAIGLSLAALLYYPLPWFAWLRRRLLRVQEYLADAAAAPAEHRASYADLLLRLSRGVVGMRWADALMAFGNPSDLYRRITMLLQSKSTGRSRFVPGWVAMVSLVSLAVVVSGLRWGAAGWAASPDDTKAPPAKKEPADSKKDPAVGEDPAKPQPGERFIRPRDLRGVPGQAPGADQFAEFEKRMRQMMEDMRKRMADGGFGGINFPNFPGLPFGNPPVQRPGRLGVMVETPSPTLVEQLDLPEGQGLVLGEVLPDSAAAKAGLKPNDILLEFNGKPVPNNPEEFRSMVQEIKADTPVDAVILRKGKRETIKGIKLPEVKADPTDPLAGGLRPLPAFPPVPAIQGIAGAGDVKSFSIQISNDEFSIQSRESNLEIDLAGKIENGKRVLHSIKIKDGNEQHSYDKIENVPEQYRKRIDELVNRIAINKK